MKTQAIKLTVTVLGIAFAGCETPEGNPNRAGTGALIGAGIGATSGALLGGRNAGGGALIGGALGAFTGGLIGQSMDDQERARLRAQAPQTYARIDTGQPLHIADVKAMAKAGIKDDLIISQIRNTHSIYRLSASEIIELSDAGVSQKVIDYMINTPSTGANSGSTAPQTRVVYAEQAPPPLQVETVVVAPAPGYVWVAGEWEWHGRWVWVGGRWIYPPYPGAVWVSTVWIRGPHGYRCHRGYWR